MAYFPWPFFSNLEVHCPKSATFHDFNFKYFFGMPIFNKIQTESLNFNVKRWLSDSNPIVSIDFMKSELQKFYPEIIKVEVVYLASLNLFQHIHISVSNFTKYDFLIDKPFIICSASHTSFHKNIGNIIAAASIVNKEFVRVRFLFTGGSSEIIIGRSAHLVLDNEYNGEFDIFGLGYIPDIDIDFLLKKAFAVLNASFYEAENGIGLDAWPFGIPVIQSNIPSFQDHLDLQELKAFTFDPRKPHDLVENILKCLESETLRNEYINASLIASKNLCWDISAEKYLSIFQKTLKN